MKSRGVARGVARVLRRTIAAVCVCAATTGSLQAQGVTTDDTLRLTLHDVESRVLRDNPLVRISQLDASLARADIVTARLRPNPQLNVNADILPTGGGRYDPNSKQYGLQLQLPVERGNKRGLRTAVAERVADVTEARIRDVAREQLVAARIAWLELQAAHASLRIGELTYSTFDRLVELTRSRFEARQISEVEYSRIIVERGRASVERDARRLNVRQAETAIATLLGVAGPIVPRDSLVPLTRNSLTLDSLVTLALLHRPDVDAARRGTAVAAADQRLQEAIAHPDLSLSLDYTMQQTIPMYGVSVSVPIPQFNRNQGERQKVLVRQSQARLQYDAIALQVRGDVKRALDAFESNRGTLARFMDSGSDGILRRALAAKSSAEFAYRNGATSLLELLDAERTYNDIYRAYVDVVAQFNKNSALLDEAVGVLPEHD